MVIYVISPLNIAHLLSFEDPIDKFSLNLKTCPSKFHNQH